VFVLHAPTALAQGGDAARAVAAVLAEHPHDTRVLTSWPGRVSAEPARRILRDAGVATYDTPSAIAAPRCRPPRIKTLMEMPSSNPSISAVAAARGDRAALARPLLLASRSEGGARGVRHRCETEIARARPRAGRRLASQWRSNSSPDVRTSPMSEASCSIWRHPSGRRSGRRDARVCRHRPTRRAASPCNGWRGDRRTADRRCGLDPSSAPCSWPRRYAVEVIATAP
jgi:hypothetical protein